MNPTAASAYSIVPLTLLAEGLPKFDPTQFRKTPLKTLYLSLIRLFLEEFIRLVVEYRDRIISEANAQTPNSTPRRRAAKCHTPRPNRRTAAPARPKPIQAPQARAIPTITLSTSPTTHDPHHPFQTSPPHTRRSRFFALITSGSNTPNSLRYSNEN